MIPISNNPTLKIQKFKNGIYANGKYQFYLKLCELIKLPHDEIFQTVDLFENKDPYQICITLMSFSRIAHDLDNEVFLK